MSLSSVLETIETDVLNFVQAEEAKAKTAIAAGEAAVVKWWDSFKPVAEKDIQDAWTAYKPEIMASIAAVEQIGLTLLLPGSGVTFDKLAAAVAAAGAALATKGVTVGKGVLATIIQQAVVSLGNAPSP